jgi:hypothetical protein
MKKRKSISSIIRNFIKAHPGVTINDFRTAFAPTTKSMEAMFYTEHKKIVGPVVRAIKPARIAITEYMLKHPTSTTREISEKFNVDMKFVYNTITLAKGKGIILPYRKSLPLPIIKRSKANGEYVTVHKNTAPDEEIWLYECGVVAV